MPAQLIQSEDKPALIVNKDSHPFNIAYARRCNLIHFLIKLGIQGDDYFWHKGSLYRWCDK